MPASSPASLRFGVQSVSGDPFWVLVNESIFQRAEELHIELVPIEVALEYLPGEKQMEIVEQVLSWEIHALIAQGLSPALARLIANAGIPIVLLTEAEVKHPLVTAPWGLYEAGRIAARYVAERLQPSGRVLLAGGLMEGLERGATRIQGFRSVMQGYPQIEVDHIPTPWDYTNAREQILESLQENPQHYQAIFGLSDSVALAARDALRRHYPNAVPPLVIGVNGDPLALSAILQGSMAATVETPAEEMGRQVVDQALLAVQGKSLPHYFSYKPRLITRENVAEVSTEKLIAMANLPNRLIGMQRRREETQLVQTETSLEISRRISSVLERRELYTGIADLIRSNYGFDMVQIFRWAMRQREFVLEQLNGDEPAVRIPVAESGLLGYTLLHNQPTFIPDMRHSQRFPADPYWPETRTRVILPVRQGEEIIALLDLHSRSPIQHGLNALIGLQALADQLGVALRNAELYGEAVDAHHEVERASRLKSRLLANVSHEFRTPLDVIAGYSQAPLVRPDLYADELPAALLKDLRHIHTNSLHLARLINDLLDLSQAEVGELKIITALQEPRSIIQEAFESLAGNQPNAAVAWRLHLPETLPRVQVDADRLRQIVVNLLSNAAKFTEHGQIVLRAEVQADCLRLRIEDTGRGIAPELKTRIFNSFSAAEQPAAPGQGIGLGLRIAHELVKLHGGAIRLAGSSPLGSVFEVEFPVPAADTATGEPAPPPAGRSRSVALHTADLTRRAMAYMWGNYQRAFSREEMAAALGVTPGYITHVVREEMGQAPWEYLTHIRVDAAKKLLAGSTYSITEIAGQVGYNDAAYFTRVFTKITGRTPRDYRKATLNSEE